jgi:serine/threonine protein kinase
MFSLGIVLYMISTQKHPFDLDSNKRVGQIIDSIIMDDPPKPNILNPEISEGFAAFIMRLLRKQPYQRFRNYKSALNALKGEIYE